MHEVDFEKILFLFWRYDKALIKVFAWFAAEDVF